MFNTTLSSGNIDLGGYRMNARHKLHWQCRDAPETSWHLLPLEPCLGPHAAYKLLFVSQVRRRFTPRKG